MEQMTVVFKGGDMPQEIAKELFENGGFIVRILILAIFTKGFVLIGPKGFSRRL
jgi:hypothetical protein